MRFLFVDRILESTPGRFVKGIKHVSSEDTFLSTDVEGRICFINSLIGETLGQLAAWNVMEYHGFNLRPVAGVVARASLHRPVYLGETLLLESFIDNLDEQAVEYHSVARVGDELVFSIEGALGPLLPMADFIDRALVERQYHEVYRPGEWSASQAIPLKEGNISLYSMQFDAIVASEQAKSLVAIKNINRAAAYFADHFPNKPVLPLTVLLECKLNLAKEFIQRAHYHLNYQVSELRKIKMNGFVQPGDVITTSLQVKSQDENELVLSFRTEVEAKRVCVVELVCQNKGS